MTMTMTRPSAAGATTSSSSGKDGSHCLRPDFVLNLETLFQREVDASATPNADTTSSYTAANTGGNLRVKNNNYQRNGDATENDVHRENVGAMGEIELGVKRDCGGDSDNTGYLSGRRVLLSNSDRQYIRTYPLRVIDQLRLCYYETKPDAPSCFKTMRTYGFECIHCNKVRRSPAFRQKKRGFRKYPKQANDVVRDLLDFRSHLNVCSNVSSDLVTYLNWMEKWCRFPKVVNSVAIPISHRLDRLRKTSSNALTTVAVAVAQKLLPPLAPSPQKKKRRVLQDSDLALLNKSKRSARSRSHSVLENIDSLA